VRVTEALTAAPDLTLIISDATTGVAECPDGGPPNRLLHMGHF